ncbi:MAG: endonuclease V [Calditrichaeota bacterium]|nr:MAG: endonuclease V [Calditrichota bacterium]
MRIRKLHRWPSSYREARNLQIELARQLVLEFPPVEINLIAGADASYVKGSKEVFAGVVVMKFPDLQIIEQASYKSQVNFPYIPGLLSFRESPVLLEAFAKLRSTPDVAIFDGHGIAHPRGFGLASHMGMWLNLPAIGCAKKNLVGTYKEVENSKGAYSLINYEGKVVGAALRTRTNVRPVFISPGYKIDLPNSLRIILSSVKKYRIPEPIRQAHIFVNQLRAES